MKKLDKYIVKSLVETFFFGILIFTSVLLASEAFLDVIKQISAYGIPLKVALLVVVLKLPAIIVYTLPMALLVSVILTYNRLNNNFEITAVRSVGVSLYRLIVPAVVLGVITALVTVALNEFIVPKANYQARNIMLWALTQKNLPRNNENFVFKDLGEDNCLRRLFYVEKYKNNLMTGVIVIDQTQENTTKIIQAKDVISEAERWIFNDGTVYTVSNDGDVTNTSSFKTIVLEDPVKIDLKRKDLRSKEYNYLELAELIDKQVKKHGQVSNSVLIKWHSKLAMPVTCILIVLVGVPLALSPPRARFNRGIGFSVIMIFLFYLLRALSSSLGEINLIPALLAAWLPNIVILILALYLLHKKNYC
ncbi:MAG: LptF/LptG family permease [Vampirovibrionia bacterium]